MKQEEIIEGNKLIAVFMGYKYGANDSINGFKGVLNKDEKSGLLLDHTREGQGAWSSKWHSSWDWLMPVVEKIERSNFDNYVFNYNITGDGITISLFDDGSGLISYSVNDWGGSKLSGTYKAVVQFIKWYNKQINP